MQAEGAAERRSTRCWRALDGLNQEIIGFEAELERLRALQQSREKDRVALDHEMRKLGEDLARTNSRLSRGAAGTGAAAPRRREIGRAARAQSQPRWRRRSGCARESEEALEAQRGELEKLEGQAAHASAKSTRRLRAELAGLEERHRGERSAMGAAGTAVPRDHATAATRSRREIERLGEQRARLLADNIELDQKAARAGRADHRRSKRRSTRWPRRTPACAKRCAPARKS